MYFDKSSQASSSYCDKYIKKCLHKKIIIAYIQKNPLTLSRKWL